MMKKIARSVFAAVFFVIIPAYAGQSYYDTPEQAIDALVAAAKEENSSILSLVGDEAQDLVSSGDPVADRLERQNFVKAYEKKHNIILEDEGGRAILEVGPADWPFPIPVVKDGQKWRFDTAQGKQEILYRRVGRNEENTLQTSLAYVDAQNEYARIMQEEKGDAEYAQRVISGEGKKDGLYWPASAEEKPSPLGELMAQASEEGYGGKEGHHPYHGYYYKILTRQGPSALGGAIDYVTHGRMIGGFGLIAWPAKYRNSGVMTFIVNHEGTVYQSDLGPDTEKEASRITTFDPGPGWEAVEEEQPTP